MPPPSATAEPDSEAAPVSTTEVKGRFTNRTLLKSPLRRNVSQFLVEEGYKECWLVDAKEVQVGARIGEGAAATVWQGEWRHTPVAVKRCNNIDATNRTDRDALLSEINVLRTLRHPNITLFMGAVINEADLFILLEWMPGGSLQHLLFRNHGRPLPMKMTSSIARDTLVGLNFLHKCNPPVIHRDLKPANILIGPNGEAKIADFGLSSFSADSNGGIPSDVANISMGQNGLGTFRYMAPEVYRGENSGEPADIYSFGLILNYMATGQHPYHTHSIAAWQEMIKDFRGAYQPSSRLPKNFRNLVMSCCHGDAARRQDADWVFAELEVAKANCTVTSWLNFYSLFSCCGESVVNSVHFSPTPEQLYEVPRDLTELRRSVAQEKTELSRLSVQESGGVRDSAATEQMEREVPLELNRADSIEKDVDNVHDRITDDLTEDLTEEAAGEKDELISKPSAVVGESAATAKVVRMYSIDSVDEGVGSLHNRITEVAGEEDELIGMEF